jgi:7-cyano-7-deazaguanine reductase
MDPQQDSEKETALNGAADILETFETPESDGQQVLTFDTDEVTAQCPFDFGGPDFYTFKLRYIPNDICIESKSLKLYLQSFRDKEITAEEFGSEIFNAFTELLGPKKMYIRLEQARRGGIEETVEMGDQELRP